MIAHIGKHFADPALSIARVKRAFAFTRFPKRSVAGIAAQAGFSNVSHFNRLFSQRFGDSPSGVRSRG